MFRLYNELTFNSIGMNHGICINLYKLNANEPIQLSFRFNYSNDLFCTPPNEHDQITLSAKEEM